MLVQLIRALRPLVAVSGLALALAACGDGRSPTASTGTGQDRDLSVGEIGIGGDGSTIAPGEPYPDDAIGAAVQDLIARFAKLGAAATYEGESLERSFFFPPAHRVRVKGGEIRVYGYDSVAALKADATRISPDGGTLGETAVHWVEPPHFYAFDRSIVLYVGVDDGILAVLESALGPPFAGQGAVPDKTYPEPGDGRADMYVPTLIVAGTEEEVAGLLPYLRDDALASRLKAVDLSANWVVAVFRGEMPTAGYGVQIEGVALAAEGDVVVTVRLEDPGIDALVAQVLTYPYDVDVVPRADGVDPQQAPWVAIATDGQLLARFDGGVSWPGCGIVDPTPPEAMPIQAYLLGAISQVESFADAGGADATGVLVEGEIADETNIDRAWVDIVADTQLSFDGETFAPPTLADLAPGRRVQVLVTGAVRESDPVQVVARAVTLFR